ncbi:MAG: DNA-binding protein [Bdellovibrionales bacterium]|nr:DNA-binding protein [Bdellovibrionales bacterium]MBT7767252.1 DNA-binding protein [Bdellovibrionales bacterium]
MPNYKVATPTRTLIGRLDYGEDILEQLTSICVRGEIHAGRMQGIGALQSATLAYFHQDTREYENILFSQHMEIVSLIGNVSLKDGKPFVHAHMSIADQNGKVYGGHLVEGNIIFAAEFVMTELSCKPLDRLLDPTTGLYLWQFD